jgi:hypothetical protein
MTEHRLQLTLLPGVFAVCRFDGHAAVPAWAATGDFNSITRAGDELSVVCAQDAVPHGVRCEGDWRCLRIAGAIDFSQFGVLASLLIPLAEAGISVFAVSTFDTDYVLVKEKDLAAARAALSEHGHTFP